MDGRGSLAERIVRELFGKELSRRVGSVVEGRLDAFVRPLFIVREESPAVGGRDCVVSIISLQKKDKIVLYLNEWLSIRRLNTCGSCCPSTIMLLR
jgi:hypothetical protein